MGSCGAADFTSITPQEFQKVIADTTVQVVDARTADEYAEGHIARATNIDVLQADFAEKAAALDVKRTVAVYCRSGRRSKKAARILADKGYRVVELDKGFIGWSEAKLPIVEQ